MLIYNTDQLAYSAIQLLDTYLLPSYQDSKNLEAKQNCLIAIPLATQSALNTSFGLITATRHQLGARFDIAHGLASTIMMPYVLSWNFEFALNQFAKLALFLNLPSSSKEPRALAQSFLRHTEELIVSLNLNKKLRDFIEDKNRLQEIIQPILASPYLHTNPDQ